jgi:polysaccharide deacetylase family protein (PEP-CTERM system associated)
MPVTHALTVDVEDWYHVGNLAQFVPRAEWDTLPARVEESTALLLDLFDKHSVRGTFFVLGRVAVRHPDLVREIARRGHEVASHGFDHQNVSTMSRDEFAADLDRSIDAIGDAAHVRPTGYRAPNFSIGESSRWALDVLVERGFTFDSSVFPARHPTYGSRSPIHEPHLVETARGFIWEYPLTTKRIAGIEVGASGGAYLRLLPTALVRSAFRTMERRGTGGCLYMHPWEVDAQQPRVPLPALRRVRQYHGTGRNLGRIERLLTQFSFAPVGQCLQLGSTPTPDTHVRP